MPDIMAVSKGLGAGYQPIGAMLASERIDSALKHGGGVFHHGHTFVGHPVACAAALATLQVIHSEKLLPAVRSSGTVLQTALQKHLGGHPHVGDIRGRGLFQGVEIVADRASKAPFAPSLKVHAQIKACAMQNGLICYPMGGTVDGLRGDHVLIAPPYIIRPDEIGELVDKLAWAIDSALTSIAPREGLKNWV